MTRKPETANVVLDPYNGHTANFQLIVNGKMIANDQLNHGEWNVYGEVEIHWTGHTYKFNTSDCQVGGEKLNIGYVPAPGKRDSIVVTCGTYEEGTNRGTTTTSSSVPPSTTSSTTVASTTSAPTTSTTARTPSTNGNVPCTVNCGIASSLGVAVSPSHEELPFTGGSADVTVAVGVAVVMCGIAMRLKAWRLRHG